MADINVKTLEAKHVADTEGFIDAAIQNPDNDRRGGVPDLVNGPSFTRSQTISATIDGKFVITDPLYDVYIVQWDFECLDTDVCTGRYFTRNNSGVAENFYDASPINTFEVGGLVAYIMEPGKTPFPSNNPQVIGPSAPVQTVPLRFNSSMLSGNSRVVGSDFQVKYLGPEVSAQGLWTQSTYSSYKARDHSYFTVGAGAATAVQDDIYTETKEMPPGDISSMVKYPGSVQRPAYDGILQSAIINYHNNFPSLPLHNYKKYKGIRPTGAANNFDLFVAEHKNAADIVTLPNPPIWDANCEIHYAVGTGIPIAHPLQIIRRLTVETFPNPNDSLIAFAHPSPLADMVLLADVMNAFRTQQRFWQAKDNALGNFSRALRKGVKTAMKVGKAAGTVAAVSNPQVAAGMQTLKTAKQTMKTVPNSSVEQNAREIQRLSSMIGQMKVNGETGGSSTGNLKLAKAGRKRSKPAGRT